MNRLCKYLIIIHILLAGCEQKATAEIAFSDLNMDHVKATGKMIQEKSMGLHRVQAGQSPCFILLRLKVLIFPFSSLTIALRSNSSIGASFMGGIIVEFMGVFYLI